MQRAVALLARGVGGLVNKASSDMVDSSFNKWVSDPSWGDASLWRTPYQGGPFKPVVWESSAARVTLQGR